MNATVSFLAGLGFFFSGIDFLASNLVQLVGRRFRRVLMLVGRHRVMTALAGIVAGVLIQSANAVASIIIGLVGGGILDKRRAILIPTWAHVGTSSLVLLVTIDMRVPTALMIAAAGVAIYLKLHQADRFRHAIGALLGAGILFYGIYMMKIGAAPIEALLPQSGVMRALIHQPGALLALGAVLSFACQSSSVASALAITAVKAGLFNFGAACWLIYGANLGSGLTYLMLGRTNQGEAAQIALMQVAQKVLGFLAILAVTGILRLTNGPTVEEIAGIISASLSVQVALVFLIYQVFGSVLCSLMASPLITLFARLAPPSALHDMSKPAYLIDDALVEPSFALDLVEREEARIAGFLPMMLDDQRSDRPDGTLPHTALQQAVKTVTQAMTDYLEAIADRTIERSERERLVRLQHRTLNLAATVAALNEFANECKILREETGAGLADQLVEPMHALLTAFVDTVTSEDPSDREFALGLLGQRDELMERIRLRILRRADLSSKAEKASFSATVLFERIVWLARRNVLLFDPEGQGRENSYEDPGAAEYLQDHPTVA